MRINYINPVIKNQYIKISLISFLFLSILFLVVFAVSIPDKDKEFLVFSISLSMIFIGFFLTMLGFYIFTKNISSYKKEKLSFGLNIYGSSQYNSGIGFFVYHQVLAFISFAGGIYVIYSMYSVLMEN